MASAEIESGICGFCTTVTTTTEGRTVRVEFETDCGYVEQLAEALTEVDPYREISYRGEGPVTLRLAAEHLVHPACPVPSGHHQGDRGRGRPGPAQGREHQAVQGLSLREAGPRRTRVPPRVSR